MKLALLSQFSLSIMILLTASAHALDWKELPAIPDKEGFAGMYAGVSGGALIAAGGANFPDKKPWEGGTKAWYDTVYVLEQPDGAWKKAGQLPTARGYGLSITTDEGVLCIGGADSTRHYADCFVLVWKDRKLTMKEVPALPQACANVTGARLGDTVYLAGGIATPTATQTLPGFWTLDLKNLARGWQSLPTWPGRPRMLAIGAANEGSFFIAGGTDLHADAEGKPARTYLKDGFRYTPGQGWKAIAELPQASVAPPVPSPGRAGGFLVLGGDDGANVNFEPKTKHPGFPHTVFAYDAAKDAWSAAGKMPFANVTNPATEWRGMTVVVSGEARPGVRSPAVWGAHK